MYRFKMCYFWLLVLAQIFRIFSQETTTVEPEELPYAEIPGVDLSGINDTYKEYEQIKPVVGEDFTDDLATWEPPESLSNKFPYSLMGYKDKKPIWTAEFGKMDIRSVVDEGGPIVQEFEHYVRQAAYRIYQSMKNQSGENETLGDALFLVDCADVKLRQVAHFPVLKLVIKLAYQYRDLINGHLGPSAFINTSILAQSVIKLVKPVLGPAFTKIRVMGNKKEKWEPVVREIFGAENLPVFYGGFKQDYKPLAVYG